MGLDKANQLDLDNDSFDPARQEPTSGLRGKKPRLPPVGDFWRSLARAYHPQCGIKLSPVRPKDPSLEECRGDVLRAAESILKETD